MHVRYTKYVAYWLKKAESRKLGSRYWRSAWYHWRRNMWRQYRWYWWLIRFDSKMSRYLKRCPDLLKATQARLKENRAARSTLIASYRKQQAEFSKKLQKANKDSTSAKRARRSVRRQQAQEAFRGYYRNWIKWERKFWKTRPGRKEERLALYKMRKWRAQYMSYMRARIKYYDKKVHKAKKGSRVFEARWSYAMVYRYYYLYGLKRTTWFEGKALRRYKKGSKNWLKLYRARGRNFRTEVYFRECAAWPRAIAGSEICLRSKFSSWCQAYLCGATARCRGAQICLPISAPPPARAPARPPARRARAVLACVRAGAIGLARLGMLDACGSWPSHTTPTGAASPSPRRCVRPRARRSTGALARHLTRLSRALACPALSTDQLPTHDDGHDSQAHLCVQEGIECKEEVVALVPVVLQVVSSLPRVLALHKEALVLEDASPRVALQGIPWLRSLHAAHELLLLLLGWEVWGCYIRASWVSARR